MHLVPAPGGLRMPRGSGASLARGGHGWAVEPGCGAFEFLAFEYGERLAAVRVWLR